jgi:hypothetical protein
MGTQTPSVPAPVPVVGIDKTDPIRRFTSAAIQSAVDSVLSSLKPEAKGAVVAHFDETGASVVLTVMGKIKAPLAGEGKWSVVGVLRTDWSGKLTEEAEARFDW